MNEQSFIYSTANVETDSISWSSLTLFNIELSDWGNEAAQKVSGVFVVMCIMLVKTWGLKVIVYFYFLKIRCDDKFGTSVP